MDFLNTNSAETTPLLNVDNLIYASDIDIKIENNGVIVGFIITTVSPIRFIGILDFGCHGDAFEEYRINQSLSTLNFIYNTQESYTPSQMIGESTSMQPYISLMDDIVLFQGTTTDITIYGDNFDNNIEFNFGDQITINSITSVIPTEIVVNVTAAAVNQVATDIILTRGNSIHYGNTPTITVTDVVIGNGPAGTYIANFNSSAGGNGDAAFDGNWNLTIEGGINSLDGFFVTSDATTPSNGTGPNAAYDGYYLFTERSGTNYGIGKNGYIETTYFHELTQISFMYHMFGVDIQDLVLESKDVDGLWHERLRLTGAQQSSQDDIFISSGNIDTTSWDATSIRFKFEDNGGSYANDIAIDSIIITSI